MIGRTQEFTDATFKIIRIVAAHQYLVCSQAAVFKPGVVEVDGTRCYGKKKTLDKRKLKASAKQKMLKAQKDKVKQFKKTKRTPLKKPAGTAIHAGRFLMVKHRQSSSSAVLPLPRRSTAAAAPGPPETTSEVVPLLQDRLSAKHHLIGSDSSKGLAGAWKQLGLTSVRAKHSQSEYTPVNKVSFKHVPKILLKSLMKKGGEYKKPMMIPAGSSAGKIIGGDQACESLASTMTRSMRRMNLTGRLDASLDMEHINPMAAVFFSTTPSLESIVEAFANYRQRHEDAVPPAEMYTNLKWMSDM